MHCDQPTGNVYLTEKVVDGSGCRCVVKCSECVVIRECGNTFLIDVGKIREKILNVIVSSMPGNAKTSCYGIVVVALTATSRRTTNGLFGWSCTNGNFVVNLLLASSK